MRHAFYIFNLFFLLLVIIACFVIMLSPRGFPPRFIITSHTLSTPLEQEQMQINPQKIYDNDLFDTYSKPAPSIAPAPFSVTPLPAPPPKRDIAPMPTLPQRPPVKFLDPLPVSLKGIITTSLDDGHNSALIEDQKTASEMIYKVNDKIQDATVLRIYPNKVVLIRSNGQQEILYLRSRDAQLDPAYATLVGWDHVIRKLNEASYIIYVEPFIERIPTLGHFLEALGITVVYKAGLPVGCRIGPLEENSLGIALGLQKGDIITAINNIPVTDASHRYEIYQSLIETANKQQSITAVLQRDRKQLILTYRIELSELTAEAPAVTEHKSMLPNRHPNTPTYGSGMSEKRDIKPIYSRYETASIQKPAPLSSLEPHE